MVFIKLAKLDGFGVFLQVPIPWVHGGHSL